MTNEEFIKEYGMTIEQAIEKVRLRGEKNKASIDGLMDEVYELKFTQTLKSKLEWFQNLDKRKRELIELRSKNEI